MRVGVVGTAGAAVDVRRPGLREKVALPTVAVTSREVAISDIGRQLSRTAEGDEAARGVMVRYDLRNISYTDLVKMADELQAAGALSTADYLDFIGPSPAYASLDGGVVADWNAPRDYLALHEQQLASLMRSGAESRFIEFAGYQLALFQHFDALHRV